MTDIVEANKAICNEFDRQTPWGELNRVGSIPSTVYYGMKAKGILGPKGEVLDEKALLKWLSDKDNAAFRTRPGMLI